MLTCLSSNLQPSSFTSLHLSPNRYSPSPCKYNYYIDSTHYINTTSIITLATESMAGKDISIRFQVEVPGDVAQVKWSILKFQQFEQSLHRISTTIVCSVGLQRRVRREIFYHLAWSQSSRHL